MLRINETCYYSRDNSNLVVNDVTRTEHEFKAHTHTHTHTHTQTHSRARLLLQGSQAGDDGIEFLQISAHKCHVNYPARPRANHLTAGDVLLSVDVFA